jgi:hypothetical protein
MKKIMLCVLSVLSSPIYADVLGLSNPAEMAENKGWGVYSAAHYWAASDLAAVQKFNGKWADTYAPRDGKNLTVGSGRAEAGVSYDSWRLAGVYRQEQVIEMSRDAADLVYFEQQKIAVPAGRTFAAQVRIEGFEAQGARLDKGFAVWQNEALSVSLGAGVSLLRGTRVRLATADGTVLSTATGYAYNATLEDANSRASYPFIRPATPEGNGYAVDVGAKMKWANGARLDVAVNDLFGQMTWRNMPHTVEVANSQTLTRDALGNVTYNPAASGVNDVNRRTVLQTLSPKLSAQLTYPVANVDWLLGMGRLQGLWLPELGAAYRIHPSWQVRAGYDTRFGTLELGLQHQWGRLSVRSSSANLSQAKGMGLSAEVRIPLGG